MAAAQPRLLVADIVALARRASMSSSYKPALLKALVRLAKSSSTNSISLRDLAMEFLKLYWTQTVVFHMRQAASLSKEPQVVQAIRKSATDYHVRAFTELPQDVLEGLVKRLATILPINVLEAFQRSKPDNMMPLYAWSPGSPSLVLHDGVREFLSENHSVLVSVANLWWARYLERVNLLAPLLIDKVERDGATRSSLAKYLKILKATDASTCFYCERDLTTDGPIHVDHLIPWSFLLSDPLWDLVLACERCNLSKSDSLPNREYLGRLAEVHSRRTRSQLPFGISGLVLPASEVDRFYDAALSVEWPANWSPTGPKILRPLHGS